MCVSVQVCVNPLLVRCVSRCARGCLSPLAAAVGGIASQEVLKALTGKFTPLQQWVCPTSNPLFANLLLHVGAIVDRQIVV